MILPALNLGLSNVNWANPVSDDNRNQGLIGWWLAGGLGFGSNKWFDTSPYQNNGTLILMDPSTDWVSTGQASGVALDFSGDTNAYVQLPVATLNFTYGVSYCAWFQSNSATADQHLYGGYDLSGGFAGSGIRLVGTSGKVEFWNGTSWAASGLTSYKSTSWVFCVVTNDGTNTRFYQNGKLDNTVAHGSPGNSSGTRAIGSRRDGSTSHAFDGMVSDFRIFNYVLQESEIRALYLDSLQGYPRTLNRISVPLGKPPAASSVLPALDEGMLVGGLQSLSGGLC